MSDDPTARPPRPLRRHRAEDLFDAILAFLDFAPEHAALAEDIARAAVERAGALGPGRLTLAERAEVSARAAVRHLHTDYEEALEILAGSGFRGDEALYQEARARAGAGVEEFLDRHRRPLP